MGNRDGKKFFVKQYFKKKYFFQIRNCFHLLKLKMPSKILFSIVWLIILRKKVFYKINT